MLSNHKISKYTLWGLLSITVAVIAIFFLGGYVDNNAEMKEPVFTDLMLYWGYTLVCLGLVTTLFFAVVQFFNLLKNHPKEAIKTFIILGSFVLVLILGYVFGNGEPLELSGYSGAHNVEFWLKLTDMFLYTGYLFLGGAIAVILVSSVAKMIKK